MLEATGCCSAAHLLSSTPSEDRGSPSRGRDTPERLSFDFKPQRAHEQAPRGGFPEVGDDA
jgi:hypothetical protein